LYNGSSDSNLTEGEPITTQTASTPATTTAATRSTTTAVQTTTMITFDFATTTTMEFPETNSMTTVTTDIRDNEGMYMIEFNII
jgi:hypothetical protein